MRLAWQAVSRCPSRAMNARHPSRVTGSFGQLLPVSHCWLPAKLDPRALGASQNLVRGKGALCLTVSPGWTRCRYVG